jgi:peptide/nickel transport system substrate-binding protein
MNKIKLIALVFSAIILIAGCGSKKDTKTDNKTENQVAPVDTQNAAIGDWVVIRELSDPDKLNPIVSTSANADEIQTYIFETLLNQDRITYDLYPLLTDLPEVSPDNLSYTFKLKKDIKFSDGQPLTGEDIVFTLKAIKNPYVDDAPTRNYFEMIEKAEIVNGDPSS